jgi:hypothetical protein
MKRVLVAVLVVQVGMFLSGCKKKTEEPSGSDAGDTSRPVARKPAVVEKEEPKRPDTSRGLVGWWNFDEVSGKTAADSSGEGHNGTLKGSLSFDGNSVTGHVGKALQFSGGDNYVEIVGYKGIVGTQARTVAAWIKTKRDNGQILSWGLDEGGGMFIFGYVQGRRRIGVTPQGGYLYMNAKTHDDAWHHVAAVVEEAELPNLHDHVKIYKDGEVAEIHDIGILDLWPIDTISDLDVRIGKGFEGVIDDVRIYDRALSAEEIELLFAGK